eukprot:86784_1
MSTRTSVCARCKSQCESTVIASAKLIISYADSDERYGDEQKDRRSLNDLTMCNEEEVCPIHFRAIQRKDNVSGFTILLVPSEAFAKFHRTYKDVIDKYHIYLDQTGRFAGTKGDNGYEQFKDVALTSYHFDQTRTISDIGSKSTASGTFQDILIRDPKHPKRRKKKRGFFVSHSQTEQKKYPYGGTHSNTGTVANVRHNPYGVNQPDDNPKRKPNHNNTAVTAPEDECITSEVLKEIYAHHHGVFDPDKRKQKTVRKQSGRWSYPEAHLFMDLHKDYGSVRAAGKVLFNTEEFKNSMISKGFPDRGCTNWQAAHGSFLNGRHTLLNKTCTDWVINSNNGEKELRERPTPEALALKLKCNKMQKQIDDKRLAKYPLGNVGNLLLPSAQASFGQHTPVIAGLNEHQASHNEKVYAKDRFFLLKQQHFDWQRKQADVDTQISKELTKVIGRLGMTDEDKREHIKLCKFVNTEWTEDTKADVLRSVKNNPTEYLLTWQIEDQTNKQQMISKLNEIFQKL